MYRRKLKYPHIVENGIETKRCSKCCYYLPLTQFYKDKSTRDGLAHYCGVCLCVLGKKNYALNKDLILERNRRWFQKHKERASQYKSQWQKDNKDKRNKRLMERYYNEPNYRLAVLLRGRVLKAIENNQKTGTTLELLGCSIDKFRIYLESKFADGMTWENHGDYWHIDHIRPCASFDLSDPQQLRECFHYTNQQPLLAVENMKKQDKWDEKNNIDIILK